MVRGPRKHLKRLNAPKSWMLDKLGGTFAPRPRCGPHKLIESIPLTLLLTRKLKCAETSREVAHILRDRMIKIDGRVRTDKNYPVGVLDVFSIPKTNEHYRILYNVNKRFCMQSITEEEALFKVCKVVKKKMENKGVLTVYTGDGRTIRYASPNIKVGDSVKFDLAKGEVVEHYPFEADMTVFVLRGKNTGCVGVITEIKKHISGFDMVNIVDGNGRAFITRSSNAIVIGEKGQSVITLTRERGIKISEFMRSNVIYGELREE
jgi:small subunit ribosomal protein S4e